MNEYSLEQFCEDISIHREFDTIWMGKAYLIALANEADI